MIERKFVAEKLKEFQVQEFISKSLKNVGHSHTKVLRTPLGEKIIVFASRPGLVVGRKGENIKKLTITLKKRFGFEDPQIEINEVDNIFLDAQIVAEMIASTLERFGPQRFKGVGHKMLADVMNSGALGVEILITGKIPGARAKRWRFYQGYLKKCGDVALGVRTSHTCAQLKSGSIGIQVKIMPPDLILPDKITLFKKEAEEEKEPAEGKKEEAPKEEDSKEKVVEVKEEDKPEKEAEKKTAKKKTKKKKKTAKKKETEESSSPSKPETLAEETEDETEK